MKRFSNIGLWLSIICFIPILICAYGLNIFPKTLKIIIITILSLIVLSGILSNPLTKNKWFLDD